MGLYSVALALIQETYKKKVINIFLKNATLQKQAKFTILSIFVQNCLAKTKKNMAFELTKNLVVFYHI